MESGVFFSDGVRTLEWEMWKIERRSVWRLPWRRSPLSYSVFAWWAARKKKEKPAFKATWPFVTPVHQAFTYLSTDHFLHVAAHPWTPTATALLADWFKNQWSANKGIKTSWDLRFFFPFCPPPFAAPLPLSSSSFFEKHFSWLFQIKSEKKRTNLSRYCA